MPGHHFAQTKWRCDVSDTQSKLSLAAMLAAHWPAARRTLPQGLAARAFSALSEFHLYRPAVMENLGELAANSVLQMQVLIGEFRDEGLTR
jgi:hypothetical protein